MSDSSVLELQRSLEEVEAQLADREKALPAHTVRPHQLIEIEELEERVAALRQRLALAKTKG